MPKFIDLTGKRFGRWLVVERVPSDKLGAQWQCICDCGTERVADSASLVHNRSKSCGCLNNELSSARSRKDITGQQFGRLTVISFAYMEFECAYWLCKCSCGKEKIVRGASLRQGLTKSCGCLAVEKSIDRNTTHGLSGTKEYNVVCARKRSERKRQLDSEWTPEMEVFLRRLFQECVVCGMTNEEHLAEFGTSLHVDHVYPLKNGNGLCPGNATVLCKHCNSEKHVKDLDDLPERTRNRIKLTADIFKLLWEGT